MKLQDACNLAAALSVASAHTIMQSFNGNPMGDAIHMPSSNMYQSDVNANTLACNGAPATGFRSSSKKITVQAGSTVTGPWLHELGSTGSNPGADTDNKFIDGLDDTEGAIGDGPERHGNVPSFEISPHSVPETPDTDHSRTRFPEHYYDDHDSGINESHDMGEESNDDERQHQAPVVYPRAIDRSHEILTGDAEENVQLRDGADYDRLVVEQLPSRGPLPVVSLSPRPNANTGYSKSWLPPLRTVSETFESDMLREEPSQQHALDNDKRNQLLKFYVDEVAQWR
ncbi:hypothetical protein VE02_00502 [Pseudogymnoascus sp. 03VT05]|nr:hypothetical protein VE02_00502 [Pseudogymnoascus sp. 03VT05]